MQARRITFSDDSFRARTTGDRAAETESGLQRIDGGPTGGRDAANRFDDNRFQAGKPLGSGFGDDADLRRRRRRG